MKFLLSLLFVSSVASAAQITGAGATFPYPIYAKWAEAYNIKTGIGLNYQSIGSGGGIKQIKSKTVDFGASDKPLSKKELDEFGLVQFPAIIGGVVPIVNIEGIKAGQLKLTPELISNIFLGKIKNWNDKAIAEVNPDLSLPNKNIQIIHRADGSGTTFLFTDYLSKISEEWKSKVGAGKAVKWPTGMGGKGNEGVANQVKRIKGSIGYVEYAYVKRNNISHAQLQNRDGNWVNPNQETFKAAAAGAKWTEMNDVLTNQVGEKSWPISGASFILMYEKQSNPIAGKAVLKFFNWCYTNGQDLASELDYVSLPEATIMKIKNEWKRFNLGDIN